MTVSHAMIEFLKGFDAKKLGKIDTDRLAATIQSFALYKTPRETEKTYVSGGKEITGSYDFMCRLPCQTEGDRARNQEWLSGLTDWIFRQNRAGNRPVVNGATCSDIKVSSPYYMGDTEKGNAIYSMTIAIKWREKTNG